MQATDCHTLETREPAISAIYFAALFTSGTALRYGSLEPRQVNVWRQTLNGKTVRRLINDNPVTAPATVNESVIQ